MRIHRELRCPSCGELSRLGSRACAACGHPLESERDAVEVESILSDIEELMELIGEDAAAAGGEAPVGPSGVPAALGGGPGRTARVEELYRCAICGTRISAGDTTCRICGTALETGPRQRLLITRVGPPTGEIEPGEVELAQRLGPSEEVRVGEMPGPAQTHAQPPSPPRAGDLFAKRAVMKKRVVRRIVKKS
ncbi:MAG: hypothetical protein ACUVV6_04485 [Thermoplasmatota archaeon]